MCPQPMGRVSFIVIVLLFLLCPMSTFTDDRFFVLGKQHLMYALQELVVDRLQEGLPLEEWHHITVFFVWNCTLIISIHIINFN